MSLDEVYEKMKTHYLELQQWKNRKSGKAKYVTLNVETKAVRVKKPLSTGSKGKGKVVFVKDNSDSESDTNSDEESTDYDMMEMVAIIVKGFKKMKYGKLRKQSKF